MAERTKDWQCQECGRRMTARQAEKAMFGIDGCPGCGGADIDLYVGVSHKDLGLEDGGRDG